MGNRARDILRTHRDLDGGSCVPLLQSEASLVAERAQIYIGALDPLFQLQLWFLQLS